MSKLAHLGLARLGLVGAEGTRLARHVPVVLIPSGAATLAAEQRDERRSAGRKQKSQLLEAFISITSELDLTLFGLHRTMVHFSRKLLASHWLRQN